MIYFDNHATTPVDPDVLAAMMPYFQSEFGNAGSITHELGRRVGNAIAEATESVAQSIGATADEIVFTSGATESNNLALFGHCLHPRQKRRKLISFATEHRAILDPLQRLRSHGFEVVLLPVMDTTSSHPGMIDLDRLSAQLDDNTAMVTLMLANNEIGAIQPIAAVAQLCHRHGVTLHTDATQAVGRIPVTVDDLDVDLMSFSAHKFYGPKGIGGLFVRSRERRVVLQSQIVGGGQQNNLRSGTINSPGIIGLRCALEKSMRLMATDMDSAATVRNALWQALKREIPDLILNGPPLERAVRLDGNLNCSFPYVEGQSIMQTIPELCASSGSACTSATPHPSHVLTGIGLTEDQARCSLRFGLGRFNTMQEVETAVKLLSSAYKDLRRLGQ
jgi:cysteine desulfurase